MEQLGAGSRWLRAGEQVKGKVLRTAEAAIRLPSVILTLPLPIVPLLPGAPLYFLDRSPLPEAPAPPAFPMVSPFLPIEPPVEAGVASSPP